MSPRSAGLLLFTITADRRLRMFLVHPGGPFWKKKDVGVWSIPKGEYVEDEDPLTAAQRELFEETGIELPELKFIPLKETKLKSGKVISAWAAEVIKELEFIKSNSFEMVWPPKSGNVQNFPEIDRGGWFFAEEAKLKVNAGQKTFIEQLESMLINNDL